MRYNRVNYEGVYKIPGLITPVNSSANPTYKIYDQTDVPLDGRDSKFIHVWSDGGGNCGPASIGVVIVQEGRVSMTFGEHLGDNSSNNIAELQAIWRGLRLVRKMKKDVRVYSDSYYAIHAICQVTRGTKNRELIDKIIADLEDYPQQIEFVKVKGHSDITFNVYADSIASWFLSRNNLPASKKKRERKTLR